LPALSVARTWNLWEPSARPVYAAGHSPNAALSSAHSNVAGSSAAKVKLADVSLVGSAGPPVIVVTGAVVSTVHVWVTDRSLPARSVARTWNRCSPSLRSA
jgi:hypothetical protein